MLWITLKINLPFNLFIPGFQKLHLMLGLETRNCSNVSGPGQIWNFVERNAGGKGLGWHSWAQTLAQAPWELGQLLLLWERFLAIKEHKCRMNLPNCILAYAQVVHNGYLQIRLLFRYQHNFMFGRWSWANFVLYSKMRMSKMKWGSALTLSKPFTVVCYRLKKYK